MQRGHYVVNSPARCPCGRVHSRAKWNSPQGWQVHYTDAAAGHQMTGGDLGCL